MADTDDTETNLVEREQMTKFQMTRLVIAFWILGLCNNVGYVVMLAAAHDLLADFGSKSKEELRKKFKRDCNEIGTGAILLADILPMILAKAVAPFVPLMVHYRFATMVSLTTLGFLLSALGKDTEHAELFIIMGVISISFSCGIGESTLLAYTAFFSTNNVISTWSSGTGAAGVIGSVLYSSLREAKLSRKCSLLIMIIWPILMASAFWGLVKHPRLKKPKERTSEVATSTVEQTKYHIPITEDMHTTLGKLKIFRKILFIYIAPFGLTYLSEYFINQALFEVLYYPGDIFAQGSQSRWYLSTYQAGVFVARSSMNIVRVNNIWMLAGLQALNALILTLEVFFGFLYFVAMCMCFVLWEGLVAGTSYVNTFRRISEEVPPLQRQFSMAMNSFGDSIMITLAGLIAIPVHTWLCNTPNPYEVRNEKKHKNATFFIQTVNSLQMNRMLTALYRV